MSRRDREHDREDWSKWDWRRPCEVVGADPADPREKATRLAAQAADVAWQERDEAFRLGGWDDEPAPRAGTVYYCAGAGESRVACTTAAQWDAAVGRRGES